MKQKIILYFITTTLLAGCAVKDGVMKPRDGFFKVLENGAAVEANRYLIDIPSSGGTFDYVLEYVGAQENGANIIGGGREMTSDGITISLLDDIKVVGTDGRRGATVVHQTMEITAGNNKGIAKKRVTVIIASIDGEAEIIISQSQ